MEIYHLRSFVTVARMGQITKAANILHMTQPAVTGHIKALEQELGIQLFARRNGRISLTKASELLLPEMEKTLGAFNATLARAKEIKGETAGQILLGIVGDPDFLRLEQFLKRVMSCMPLLEVKTKSTHAMNILDGVANGKMNVGFYIGPVTHPDIASKALCNLRYRIVAPVKSAQRLSSSSLADIACMPWLSAPESSHIHQLLVSAFGEHQLTPNVVIETDETDLHYSLVRSGLGLTLLREDIALLAEKRNELAIWKPVVINTKLSFIYRVDAGCNPSVKGMLSVLNDTWCGTEHYSD